MAISPSINITIDDPRADGYIDPTLRGYGVDIDFQEPKNTSLVNTRGMEGAPPCDVSSTRWDLNNAEIIPGINALIGKRTWTPQDMAAGDFALSGSLALWKQCLPATEVGKKFLVYADNSQTGLVTAVTLWNHADPVGVNFHVMRSAPTNSAAEFRFKVGSGTTDAYEWVFPFSQATSYPYLTHNDVTVDTWANARSGLRGTADTGGGVWKVVVMRIGNYLILQSSEHDDTWVYRLEGLIVPAGSIRIAAKWGEWAFHTGLVEYNAAPDATLSSAAKITVPTGWRVPDTTKYTAEIPTGTGITITNTGAGQVYKPQVAMITTKYHSPAVYKIQAYAQPTYAAQVTAPVDVTTRAVHGVTWSITDQWRGSRCAFKLDNENNDLTIYPNGKVTFKFEWRTGAFPALVTQFTGFVLPTFGRVGSEWIGKTIVNVEAQDRTFRLQRKRPLFLHALGGWNWADAFTLVCKWLGVPTALISVTDDGYVIDAGEWEKRSKIGNDVDGIRALDQLCELRGWRWGVNQNGVVFAGAYPTYSGTPDYTIDDTVWTEADGIQELSVENEAESFVNQVMVIGQTAIGNPAVCYWGDNSSITDNTAANFIGDDWWYVDVDADKADPQLPAQSYGRQLGRMGKVVEWKTQGKASLFPDHYVRVNATMSGLTSGTVFRITEKHGTIAPGELDCYTVFRGVYEA